MGESLDLGVSQLDNVGGLVFVTEEVVTLDSKSPQPIRSTVTSMSNWSLASTFSQVTASSGVSVSPANHTVTSPPTSAVLSGDVSGDASELEHAVRASAAAAPRAASLVNFIVGILSYGLSHG